MAMDTSRCDVSETQGKKHLLFSIKILLPSAVFCCTDISRGADKWEIAPGRAGAGAVSWAAQVPSAASESLLLEENSSPLSSAIQGEALQAPASRAPAAPQPCPAEGHFCDSPLPRWGSDRRHWAGTRTDVLLGAWRQRQRLSLPKMSRYSPGPVLLQQPPGWPRDCGCCGQLHHLSITSLRCCWL